MIITKTPFRVSLFGGSTDYPSYYENYGSKLIGFAINKYCYLTVRETPKIFPYKTRISYSKIEIVQENIDIEHNGVRGTLEYFGLRDGLEIHNFADLPAQTGIGSSSSFVVGLVNAISKMIYGDNDLLNEDLRKNYLCDAAIIIERFTLKEPGGIQDQIFAAHGGFISIDIDTDGIYKVKPMPVSQYFIDDLLKRSVLVYTGKERKSFDIAKSSNKQSEHKNKIQEIANQAYEAFINEDVDSVANLLHNSWEHKKAISDQISNEEINSTYKALQKDGMIGGKLLGSGGSGFIFGICSPKGVSKIKKKYNTIDFNISKKGSEIINV